MSAPVKPCGCTGCTAPVNECGLAMFAFYAKKLLIPGWAGSFSTAERAYRQAHVSPEKTAQYTRSADRLRQHRVNAV